MSQHAPLFSTWLTRLNSPSPCVPSYGCFRPVARFGDTAMQVAKLNLQLSKQLGRDIGRRAYTAGNSLGPGNGVQCPHKPSEMQEVITPKLHREYLLLPITCARQQSQIHCWKLRNQLENRSLLVYCRQASII